MDGFEPKKLALLRIWQILQVYSDCDHPLKQEDIADLLRKDYGIVLERKAISRNLSLLKEAGAEIASGRTGSYLCCRDFEDAELHLLIDSVLSSKYITASHSKSLIDRICALSSKYFKASVRHIHSVNDWGKTDNQALFYNIEMIDDAIEQGFQIHYDYNKYGVDKKPHKSSDQFVSPYQMLLHNQRYYGVQQLLGQHGVSPLGQNHQHADRRQKSHTAAQHPRLRKRHQLQRAFLGDAVYVYGHTGAHRISGGHRHCRSDHGLVRRRCEADRSRRERQGAGVTESQPQRHDALGNAIYRIYRGDGTRIAARKNTHGTGKGTRKIQYVIFLLVYSTYPPIST